MDTQRSILSTSAETGARPPVRVLIAKPGLDGHDRGAKVIARTLRDAGYEVIYTGLQQTPEKVVAAAVADDVRCIGLSILSGAHLPISARVLELLEEQGAGASAGDEDRIRVVVGGIIPDDDVTALQEMGVSAVFTPGTALQDVITTFAELCG